MYHLFGLHVHFSLGISYNLLQLVTEAGLKVLFPLHNQERNCANTKLALNSAAKIQAATSSKLHLYSGIIINDAAFNAAHDVSVAII